MINTLKGLIKLLIITFKNRACIEILLYSMVPSKVILISSVVGYFFSVNRAGSDDTGDPMSFPETFRDGSDGFFSKYWIKFCAVPRRGMVGGAFIADTTCAVQSLDFGFG
eukprot:m.106955 g.106955  ORF g.106955 m.106955 type:complete len:110 (-) comp13906_c0_seq1:1091-1420(-)